MKRLLSLLLLCACASNVPATAQQGYIGKSSWIVRCAGSEAECIALMYRSCQEPHFLYQGAILNRPHHWWVMYRCQ